MPWICLRKLITLISPSNETTSTCDENIDVRCYVVTNYILFSMVLLSLFYGIISWIVVKKFRNFNNYVFLSAILVNLLRFICTTIIVSSCDLTDAFVASFYTFKNVAFNVFLYFTTVYNFWLIVICYVLYIKVVKVFYIEVKRKCLKSYLYTWGVPLVVFVVCKLILLIIKVCMEDEGIFEEVRVIYVYSCVLITSCLIPAIINLTIFIKVVRALYTMKDSNSVLSKKERRRERWRRLSTIVLMFFISNIYVLTFLMWDLLDLTIVIRVSTIAIQIVTISVMFPLLKRNRSVWYEYYKSRWKNNGIYTVRT